MLHSLKRFVDIVLLFLVWVYRSLGVVIWELFEFGAQPHKHLSDEEVLTFVIRERQITLAQPRLKLSHADYWSVPFHLLYHFNIN